MRAVVSLPGDAFQRSQARVKTSLVVLEKVREDSQSERQGDVFMYPCRFVGIDDPARRRVLPIDRQNRRLAEMEIGDAVKAYRNFLNGDRSARKFSVPAERIADRMDVKFCLERPGRNVPLWEQRGLDVMTVSDLVEPITPSDDNVIVTKYSTDSVTPLIITYDGFARLGDELLASDTKYAELFRVHTGDVVVSNISAHYGAVAVVPEDLDGCIVTKEVTILRAKPPHDPRVVWVLLRSPEIRADLLLSAAGANRTRVDWVGMSTILLPRPSLNTATKIVSELVEAERLEREAGERRKAILVEAETELVLRTERALEILQAFKPPK